MLDLNNNFYLIYIIALLFLIPILVQVYKIYFSEISLKEYEKLEEIKNSGQLVVMIDKALKNDRISRRKYQEIMKLYEKEKYFNIKSNLKNKSKRGE